jgi:MFS family permease
MKDKDKKKIFVFAIASFLNDIGSNISDTILPFFITETLGADMSILGLISGIQEFFHSFVQSFSGFFSDKLKKRKIFIWLGYAFSGISKIGFAISSAWQHVLGFSILDRSGKIRDPPRDALVSEISKKEERGRNFGIIEAADNLGAVFGIILCFFLLSYFNYRSLFLIASIPSLVASFLIYLAVKEVKMRKNKNKENKKLKIKLNKNTKIVILASALFNLGFFSYSFLLIFAKDFGFETSIAPLFMLLFTLATSISSIPFGKLSDKIGRKKVLAIAYSLWIFSCIGFILADQSFEIPLLFVAYGLVLGAKMPIEPAFVSEISEPELKATTIGIFRMINGFCLLIASTIAGILWNSFGKTTPFVFSIPLAIASLIVLSFAKEK